MAHNGSRDAAGGGEGAGAAHVFMLLVREGGRGGGRGGGDALLGDVTCRSADGQMGHMMSQE